MYGEDHLMGFWAQKLPLAGLNLMPVFDQHILPCQGLLIFFFLSFLMILFHLVLLDLSNRGFKPESYKVALQCKNFLCDHLYEGRSSNFIEDM